MEEYRLLDLLSEQFFLILVLHNDLYVVTTSFIEPFAALSLVRNRLSFDKYDRQPLDQEPNLLERVERYDPISSHLFEGLNFLDGEFGKLFKFFR